MAYRRLPEPSAFLVPNSGVGAQKALGSNPTGLAHLKFLRCFGFATFACLSRTLANRFGVSFVSAHLVEQ